MKNRFSPAFIPETAVVEAYDIWSEAYDRQPGNLMLDLDERLFSGLLQNVELKDKQLADIGCGTGRHWAKLMSQKPSGITGYDVSEGMLSRLKDKFPDAKIYLITDDLFLDTPDKSYDLIISTLTVAHIQHIEAALRAWCRILKPNGEIIITDFHPGTLAQGGQRTFKHQNGYIAVRNYVHSVDKVKEIFLKNNFYPIVYEEITIDNSLKHYYEEQHALHVYEKYQGFPIIYGLHLKRKDDTA
ncbi:class I SAM-dependent methyltransferase [Runella sp.]|uniref:class I SAM-dependent methyltransferase n=1 Tax=Runella sp. TaxID=1960881 RepID=UPI003D125059